MDRLRILTKTDGVAESLRAQILRGTFSPGTPLRQQDVAARLGVSSTPVREAFGILMAEGFLERRPHRGAVVVGPPRDINDVYEIQGLIEGLAVRRLIQRNDRRVIEELTGLVTASGALATPDVHRFRILASDFHQAIVDGARSEALAEIHAILARRTIFTTPLDKAGMRQVQRHHEALLEAIGRRATKRAVAVIAEHSIWNAASVRSAGRRGLRKAADKAHV
jgi:DNA-binding GntR family transcriptional regulator